MRHGILLFTLLAFFIPSANAQSTFFKVRIENLGNEFPYVSSGVFDTPVGEAAPGPILPGGIYQFSFTAGEAQRLSFATMFVQSNDLFYAPEPTGLALWEAGQARSGDVTSELFLWDAGTELNEGPGVGANQAPRQAGANAGPADTDNFVRLVNDAYAYPAVQDVINVDLTYDGDNRFTVTITNTSTAQTLPVGGGMSVPVPLAPGVFVVHAASEMPLFTAGQADPGHGLEDLAEDGDASVLGSWLGEKTGVSTVLAPGVWVVHRAGMAVFESGQQDRGEGLEKLAEDGDPHPLHLSLSSNPERSAGVFSTPLGYGAPAPAFPGDAYEFIVIGVPGDFLSLSTMFVQSNDYFFSPAENGIALFDALDHPIEGDVTDQIDLWDAGTEANEALGVGPNQAPRQSGGNTGPADADATVRRAAGSGLSAPDLIHVTITVVPSLSLDVTIENVSTETTLVTSTNAMLSVPLAPGVFAVHTSPSPLFTNMSADRGAGLEAVAEDGNPTDLSSILESQAGIISGAFNTPEGAPGPGPLTPGQKYSFRIDAAPGAYLSLATMFVHSNDLFFAPPANGLALWDDGGYLKTGDVTDELILWDAGTEMNEEPGEGPNQAPRQTAPNTGLQDAIAAVRPVSDGFAYPAVADVIRVTIEESTPTNTSEAASEVPSTVRLAQNYPNPFNPSTQIEFELTRPGTVRLAIFDILGREIAVLADGRWAQGLHTVEWNGRDATGNPAATGMYIYRLETDAQATTRKMTLLR